MLFAKLRRNGISAHRAVLARLYSVYHLVRRLKSTVNKVPKRVECI
jgi:hypothetical protein